MPRGLPRAQENRRSVAQESCRCAALQGAEKWDQESGGEGRGTRGEGRQKKCTGGQRNCSRARKFGAFCVGIRTERCEISGGFGEFWEVLGSVEAGGGTCFVSGGEKGRGSIRQEGYANTKEIFFDTDFTDYH